MKKVKKNTRRKIPKLSETFPDFTNKNIQWFIITANNKLYTKNQQFYEKYEVIENPQSQKIYIKHIKIYDVNYQVIFTPFMTPLKKSSDKGSLKLLFILTVEGNDITNYHLSRNFIKIFNQISNSKTLNRTNFKSFYEIKSFVFQNKDITKMDDEKKYIFIYFKSLICSFSKSEKKYSNLFDFIYWFKENHGKYENKIKISCTEMSIYLNSMKYIEINHGKLPKKWFIKFILLFQKSGAEFYLKNKKNMLKNTINEYKIRNVRTEELLNQSFENLKKEKIGFENSITVYFSNYIIEKNKKNTHIFIDSSSIDQKNSVIAVMSIKKNIYQCLFFIRYKKNVKLIKKHQEKCSRITEISTELCGCEWLFVLNYINRELPDIIGVSMDFEKSLVSAATQKKLKIWGCYFHYKQNLLRKIQKGCTTQLLASICERLPFCNSPEKIIDSLTQKENQNYIDNDKKIICYMRNIFSLNINKFDYYIKIPSDYFKLTNNCCERGFQYLKNTMHEGYTFEEAIIVRFYLDEIDFYKTKKSELSYIYDHANSRVNDCITTYTEVADYQKLKKCERKPKKDKNFQKKSTKISNSKKNDYDNMIIESGSESESGSFNSIVTFKKEITKSFNFLEHSIKNNKKNYSETDGFEHINYIKKINSKNYKKINEMAATIKENNNKLYENNEIIKKKDLIIEKKDDKIDEKDKVIKKKDSELYKKDKIIEEKDALIKKTCKELGFRINELENELKKLKRE